MPYEELVAWQQFFTKRPIGWREDRRTAMMMRAFGVKEKPSQIFPSLAAMEKAEKDKDQGLRNSFMFHMMQGAVGGDKLDL